MDTLQNTLKAHALVLVANSFDPFCLSAAHILQELDIPDSNFKALLVDDPSLASPAIGEDIEQASISLAGGQSLPHVYLHGSYIGGLSELQQQGGGRPILRHRLVAAGVLPIPAKMADLESLLSSSKVVLVLNSYSAYCFAAQEIIGAYDIAKDEKILKLVYVDKRSDGDALEEAALFKSRCANLPVLFIGGESLGSLEELRAAHEKCELEAKFVAAGVFDKPADQKLRELKSAAPVAVILNNYSPYCLLVEDALKDKYKLGDKAKLVYLQGKDGEDLERAARLDTRVKEPPYIFLAGRYLPTPEFIQLDNENKLAPMLKKAGANPAAK